ncbi:hypothetical protein B0H19DRAFT_1265660 [Mycena capillaripes]|nr:hypothetical protein B0H19DRAFT_1265660 [Mycena capillaripes]
MFAKAAEMDIPHSWISSTLAGLERVNPFIAELESLNFYDDEDNIALHIEHSDSNTNENAAVISLAPGSPHSRRKLVIQRKSEAEPVFLDLFSPLVEPLHYLLLLPYGTLGWSPGRLTSNGKKFSQTRCYFKLLIASSDLTKTTMSILKTPDIHPTPAQNCRRVLGGSTPNTPRPNPGDIATDLAQIGDFVGPARMAKTSLPWSFMLPIGRDLDSEHTPEPVPPGWLMHDAYLVELADTDSPQPLTSLALTRGSQTHWPSRGLHPNGRAGPYFCAVTASLAPSTTTGGIGATSVLFRTEHIWPIATDYPIWLAATTSLVILCFLAHTGTLGGPCIRNRKSMALPLGSVRQYLAAKRPVLHGLDLLQMSRGLKRLISCINRQWMQGRLRIKH